MQALDDTWELGGRAREAAHEREEMHFGSEGDGLCRVACIGARFAVAVAIFKATMSVTACVPVIACVPVTVMVHQCK